MFILSLSCINNNSKIQDKLLNKDTVFVESNLNIDSSLGIIYLNCFLINSTKDTLIFSSLPFLVESNIVSEKIMWVLTGNNYTSPNILYVYKNQNQINFIGDGEYYPYFKNIPKIYIVLPYDSLLIRIKVPKNITDKVNPNELNYFGALVYGLKTKANIISDNYSNEFKKSYLDNLFIDSLVNCNPIDLNEFDSQYYKSNSIDTNISKFVWSIFDKKVGFK